MIYIDKQGRKFKKVKVPVEKSCAALTPCTGCYFMGDDKACEDAPDCFSRYSLSIYVEVKDEQTK